MSDQEITLWADARWVSPWVLSVWIALKEKNVPFSVQELDLSAGQHKKGDYPRQTVNGKVPAITHGDLWIAESLAIVEYIDEVFPEPPLFGEDPAARAQDRFVMGYLRSDFAELRRCMPFEGIFLGGKSPAITDVARDQSKKLTELAEWRLTTRGKKPLTIADYEIAWMLRRPMHYKGPISTAAREFSNAIWKRPSIQSWLEHDRSRFEEDAPATPKKKLAAKKSKSKPKK